MAQLGADGGHIDWSSTKAPEGLTSHGDAVTYSVDNNVLTASTADGVVFTLTADTSGNYVFNQVAQIDINGHEDESASKSLVFGFTATDGDGDKVASTASNNLTITLYKTEDIQVAHNQSHEMTGHEGSDTFKWSLSDHGDETVKNFDFKHEGGKGGDVLDVRDLLSGAHSDAKEGESGSLDQYLKFSVEGEGNNKHLELLVKHEGGMHDDGHNADQKIVLDGYSSKEAFAHDIGSSSTSDMEMLKKLVEHGNLKATDT